MKPITLREFITNPYRTLGLTAGATEAQVDAAARAMRLWDNAVPPTPNDAALLGPVRRARHDIEAAVSRLADPPSRVEDRLWWFCHTPPPESNPAPPNPSADALERHDAALLRLYRVLLTDADDASLPLWKSLIAEFEELALNDDYLAWLLDAEAGGDFEKRANMEEAAAAQWQMADRVKLALAAAADGALAGGNVTAAGQAVHLLRGGNPEPNRQTNFQPTPTPATKILDQLEDKLAQRLEQLRGVIDKAWETRQIHILRPACHRAINQFDAVLKPLVEEIKNAAAGDTDRAQRVTHEIATFLTFVADGYEAVYDFISAERALTLTMEYATATVLETDVLHRQAIAAAAANRQRRGVPPRQRKQSPGHTAET